MDEMGVISPVQGSTNWCKGLDVVSKPNGSIRLCVDLTGLNKAVKREIHPMASVEESLAQLRDSRISSKLDANSGFWQLKLGENARLLTTFLTPFGRYCYNRLPFGISSAPETFQRTMTKILTGLQNVSCHMDDILVQGKRRESHDEALRQVLRRLEEAGMTRNKDKCLFHQESLTFLGHIIDARDVSLDTRKTAAIKNYPVPTTKNEIRRLNGMLQQMVRFIPNLATHN